MRLHRLAVAIALVALIAAACTSAEAPGWTFPAATAPAAPAASAPAAGVDQPAGTPGAAEAAATGTIEIESFDLGFTPAAITVPAAGTYEVKLVNTGSIMHDVTFADGTVIAADAGQTATGSVTIPAEGLAFICSIPGHKDGGMAGAVSIEGATTGTTAGGESHGGPAPTTDVAADPNAPAYVVHDPKAPPVLEGTVHDIDLVIEEKDMTVAAGFVVKVWTFGDSVPGPVIRATVGDTIRIHLKNPATNQLPHSVDFHSSMVAWNDEMTSINPGEEKLYEYKAEFAGVWMYHCGTSPALHHIANGMVANQYLDNPIQIETGKNVRVFILDAGPSIDSSFHIVGTIFDRVIKEGIELERGNAGNWGSQAVDLSPAQGAIVEFQMAEDGLYPIVTHAFNFVGRGALGVFQAGDGDPLN